MGRKSARTIADGDDLAAMHMTKAFKSQEKGAIDEACRLLRNHPGIAAQLLPSIRMAVKRAGCEPGETTVPVTKKCGAAAEAAVLGISFCEQYTKFSATPNQLLRFYLSQMEPQAFSHHALKALNARNARECPRHLLCELCEFLTGIGSDEVIPKHARQSLDACVAFLQNRNLQRQRRALSLQLPATWEKDGLFMIQEVVDRQVCVAFRMDPCNKIVIDTGFECRMQDFAITNNWSEKTATLVSELATDGDWNLNLEFGKIGIHVSKLGQKDLHSRAAYDKVIKRMDTHKAAGSQGFQAIEDGNVCHEMRASGRAIEDGHVRHDMRASVPATPSRTNPASPPDTPDTRVRLLKNVRPRLAQRAMPFRSHLPRRSRMQPLFARNGAQQMISHLQF